VTPTPVHTWLRTTCCQSRPVPPSVGHRTASRPPIARGNAATWRLSRIRRHVSSVGRFPTTRPHSPPHPDERGPGGMKLPTLLTAQCHTWKQCHSSTAPQVHRSEHLVGKGQAPFHRSTASQPAGAPLAGVATQSAGRSPTKLWRRVYVQALPRRSVRPLCATPRRGISTAASHPGHGHHHRRCCLDLAVAVAPAAPGGPVVRPPAQGGAMDSTAGCTRARRSGTLTDNDPPLRKRRSPGQL